MAEFTVLTYFEELSFTSHFSSSYSKSSLCPAVSFPAVFIFFIFYFPSCFSFLSRVFLPRFTPLPIECPSLFYPSPFWIFSSFFLSPLFLFFINTGRRFSPHFEARYQFREKRGGKSIRASEFLFLFLFFILFSFIFFVSFFFTLCFYFFSVSVFLHHKIRFISRGFQKNIAGNFFFSFSYFSYFG